MADLQTELARGEIAQRTLDELQAKFDMIRANIHNMWSKTTATQMEEREILYHKLHALNELERSFITEIDTGRLAKKQLETENARS